QIRRGTRNTYSAVGDGKSRKNGSFSEKEEEITYAEEDKTNTILHYSKKISFLANGDYPNQTNHNLKNPLNQSLKLQGNYRS
ncbi:MAG: hypothetical protein SOT51_04230, partial [Candidatus Enterosoma sp.]|nr:hypothetical protein [Candidatus Enterosoma sp.]